MVTQLREGDVAPELELVNQVGQGVSLAGLRGREVIVYFYPKAFTPGCTTEACDFRDNLAALGGAGFTVLGVSDDPVERLGEFHREYGLNYDLLADPGSETAKRWGAWGLKTVNGVELTGALRSTVVVGADGTVRRAEYGVDAKGHVAELRDYLLGA